MHLFLNRPSAVKDTLCEAEGVEGRWGVGVGGHEFAEMNDTNTTVDYSPLALQSYCDGCNG